MRQKITIKSIVMKLGIEMVMVTVMDTEMDMGMVGTGIETI